MQECGQFAVGTDVPAVQRAAGSGGQSLGKVGQIRAGLTLTVDLGEAAELVHDPDDAAVGAGGVHHPGITCTAGLHTRKDVAIPAGSGRTTVASSSVKTVVAGGSVLDQTAPTTTRRSKVSGGGQCGNYRS